MTRLITGSLTLVVLAAGLGRVDAAYPNMGYGMPCGPCCPPCTMQMQTVQKTIMVPVMTMETRTVPQVLCRQEVRQSTYTAMISVPVQQQVTRQFCTMVPQTTTKTVNFTSCQTVMKEQQCNFCVTIPETKTVSATRQVCRMVPVVTKKTVTEDRGCWQTVPCVPTCGTPMQPTPAATEPVCPPEIPAPMADKDSSSKDSPFKQVGFRHMMRGSTCCVPCAPSCSPCTPMVQRVWVPNIVTREVDVTCYQQQIDQVPYTYNVVTYRQETRTKTIQVPQVVQVPQTKQVSCTVMVPKMENRTMTLTSYKCEPQVRTCSYSVPVPYTVQRQIQVPVCKMVAKTITCQVPVMVPCAPACAPPCGT